jgi:L-asparaginase II
MRLPCDVPLAATVKHGVVDAVHFGSLAVVDRERLLFSKGDSRRPVFLRSLFKPFRALSLVERGGYRAYSLVGAELAVIAGSHSGTPEHVDAVRSALRKMGVAETSLLCGPRPPLGPDADDRLDCLSNDCSGEHAGTLGLALLLKSKGADYLTNREVASLHRQYLSRYFGGDEVVAAATDSCGLPTWAVSLPCACSAYLRLSERADHDESARLLLAAIGENPTLYAGRRRLVAQVISRTGGRVFGKDAAEGVYCFVWRDEGVCIGLKFSDGSFRSARLVLAKVAEEAGLPLPRLERTPDEDGLLSPIKAL